MDKNTVYDSIIIGGGVAGLQAAIQLGRYRHQVLVIDSGDGRSAICRSYHNILGYPDGVSGEHLRTMGRKQAKSMGVQFVDDRAIKVERVGGESEEHLLSVTCQSDHTVFYRGRTLLFATGVMDRFPDLPGLRPCLGLTVYICPDCDGYEVSGKRTIVLGSGDTGANMALTLTHWTEQLTYVNHEQKAVSQAILTRLEEHKIAVISEPIESVLTESGAGPCEGTFQGIMLKNGTQISGERGFLAFGGNEVRTDLASQIGVERYENRHIMTDPRSKQTNIPNVWAAGDIGVHAEQVTIAMGEGSMAAIWMNKAIMAMKSNKVQNAQIK